MTAPHYTDDAVTLWHGDCLDVLATLPDNSVHAVITDPPSGIGFMGETWDSDKGGREQWSAWLAAIMREALRVTKPGGHALVWALPRTAHWTACGLEDAGWEIRDRITHLFGSGFPKSLDVSKAIDKAAPRVGLFDAFAAHYGERRKTLGLTHNAVCAAVGAHGEHNHGGASVNWEKGYGVPTRAQWATLSAMLEMPHEMWEPLIARAEAEREITGRHLAGVVTGDAGMTVSGEGKDRRDIPATPAAQQWAGWGTALKPGAEDWWVARKPLAGTVAANVQQYGTGALNIDGCRVGTEPAFTDRSGGKSSGGLLNSADGWRVTSGGAGRWPTNVVLDGAAAELLDQQSGTRKAGGSLNGDEPSKPMGGSTYGDMPGRHEWQSYGDSGGASRFFPVFRYEAKAPTVERPRDGDTAHATVKPLDLMRWLVRLVTPPGGVVLDPFAGSGTTAEACIVEGARCILIEREAAYLPLIVARLSKPIQPDLFGLHG